MQDKSFGTVLCHVLSQELVDRSRQYIKLPHHQVRCQIYLPQRKITNWPTGIPERILIFHAGTPRIVFVGFLKITTLFLFTANVVLNAPFLYNDPEQPAWVAPAGQ